MGSQQSKTLSEIDLNHISSSELAKFSNDVCTIIFSFINSEENTKFLVGCCSLVCKQWRQFLKYECGLKIEINYEKHRELKSKITNGCLKYYNVSSLNVVYNGGLSGKSINVLFKGANVHLLKELHLKSSGFEFNLENLKRVITTLPRLEVLDVEYNVMNDDALLMLSQSETMKNLRSIYVSGDFTDVGILGMVNSPYLKKLEEFYFLSRLSTSSVNALLENYKLKALQFLGTSENNNFASFATCQNLSQLTYLSVQRQPYQPYDCQIALIADNPYISNLTYLDITKQIIETENLIKLFSSDIMKTLKTLLADECEIRKEAATALASNTLIRNLTHLSLSKNSIGESGFGEIIQSPIMEKVTRLNVSRNDPFVGSGCLKICSSNYLGNLRFLDISQNRIDEFGIIGLTFGNMPRLQELDLSGNILPDEAQQLLDNCIYLKNVQVHKRGCTFVRKKPHAMK